MSKMPKILLWKNKCWESQGSNLGDLAIISATVSALKRAVPDIQIIMLSDDPEYTSNLYDIKALRINIKNIVKAVKEADLILIGGGTVFTDVSSKTIIFINTSLPYLGRFLGKPIATYGIGTGKMSWLGRLLIKGLSSSFIFCAVRDDESRRDIKKICPGIDKRIWVTEDAAFSLRLPDILPARQNRIIIAPRRIFHYKNSLLPFYLRKKLGLLPKKYFYKMEEFKNLLAELADYSVEKYGAKVTFLPMYSAIGSRKGISGYLKRKFSSRDDIICKDIHSRMRFPKQADIFLCDKPMEVIRLLATSRLLIGVPLHSLILAHVSETPFIGLSYQGKVQRFMRRAGMEEYMIDVESIDSNLSKEEFVIKINKALAEEKKLRELFCSNNNEIRESVDKPAFLIKEFFERNKEAEGN
jgi:polysaccharide pyruvyl transferase WcaK-like protein